MTWHINLHVASFLHPLGFLLQTSTPSLTMSKLPLKTVSLSFMAIGKVVQLFIC